MLEAREVWKAYRMGRMTLEVLKGVSVQVEPGACVAVVGPSGAGKSTLLHLLAGLETPTRGAVQWEGRAVSRLSDAERSRVRNRMIGIVFQCYHLLQELSALDNVMLPGLVNGRRDRRQVRRRAHACLEQVGLGARLGHRPAELSGGEQQRVAIARALVNQPTFLLCDEPTGNLDSRTGTEVMELLLGLSRREGKGLLLVTHEQKLAEGADQVVLMADGRIVDAAPAQPHPAR
jgi:lipoprotein-releasing system ATP-binding protein